MKTTFTPLTTRLAALITIALTAIVSAQPPKPGSAHFGSWPEGKSPGEIGKRVANRFIEVPHPKFGNSGMPARIIYPEVCTWWGALTFAKVTGDAELKAALIKRFEPLLRPVPAADYPHANGRNWLDEREMVPAPDHVDHTVFAAVPLELHMQTQDKRYLKLGQSMADWQWTDNPVVEWPFEHPVLKKHFPERAGKNWEEYVRKGYSWQTRLWIDDMFMITMVQAQAFRATGERKYIDRAAKEMVLYLDQLQKPNGLFHHDPKTPFFWGRGNGWMAAGMSELLRSVPADNPDRPRIMQGYKLMMEGLLQHQGETGMWHQLIDDHGSWPESSCSGMFTFAFINGVKEGWLDEKVYGPAARKGWLAVISYLDENNDIREVCNATNIHDPKNTLHGPDGRQYYLDRSRSVGDMHGQAPILWCASALLR